MDAWTYFLQSHHHWMEIPSGWDILNTLIFIGRLPVMAADLGDCARSGAAVSQNPWLPLSKLAGRLRLSPKATRDTCNLSPL